MVSVQCTLVCVRICVCTRHTDGLQIPLFAKIADPTKSNRNHSRGKGNGRKGSVQVVPVEIGGSTRPILPKPHLIIPTERTNEGKERRSGAESEYMETRVSSVSSLYPLPKVPETVDQ